MLSVVFKPISFKAAQLHLAAAGQPKTENSSSAVSLSGCWRFFRRGMSMKPPPLKNILQKNFRKSRFRTAICNDFRNPNAMMQSREMLEMPSHSSRHPLYDMIYKSVGRNSDAIGEMLRVQRKRGYENGYPEGGRTAGSAQRERFR